MGKKMKKKMKTKMRRKMQKRNSMLLCGTMLAAAMTIGGCGKEAVAETETTAEATVEKETETATTIETSAEKETEATAVTTAEKETETETADDPAAMPAPVQSSIRVYGSVQEMNDGQISIQNDNPNDMYNQIVLNVTEETQILDAVNAEIRTMDDIEAGEVLYAYVSPVMTRSMPPISNAELIICDIPADFGAPEYAKIDEVITEADGRIGLWTDRDIIYWVGEGADTEILDFATREKIDVASIKEGSKVLAWYRIALQSLPAQTTPDKIIVF